MLGSKPFSFYDDKLRQVASLVRLSIEIEYTARLAADKDRKKKILSCWWKMKLRAIVILLSHGVFHRKMWRRTVFKFDLCGRLSMHISSYLLAKEEERWMEY